MSREKQIIEEMARVWCPFPERHDCKGCCERCYEISKSEMLYDAGYRKQSEGEWKDRDYNGIAIEGYMVCSACNVMIPTCEDNHYCLSKLSYCPNCGAKMKGGAE